MTKVNLKEAVNDGLSKIDTAVKYIDSVSRWPNKDDKTFLKTRAEQARIAIQSLGHTTNPTINTIDEIKKQVESVTRYADDVIHRDTVEYAYDVETVVDHHAVQQFNNANQQLQVVQQANQALQQRLAGLPQLLQDLQDAKNEITKLQNILSGTGKKGTTKNERRVFEARIQTLNTTVQTLTKDIQTLTQQAQDAKNSEQKAITDKLAVNALLQKALQDAKDADDNKQKAITDKLAVDVQLQKAQNEAQDAKNSEQNAKNSEQKAITDKLAVDVQLQKALQDVKVAEDAKDKATLALTNSLINVKQCKDAYNLKSKEVTTLEAEIRKLEALKQTIGQRNASIDTLRKEIEKLKEDEQKMKTRYEASIEQLKGQLAAKQPSDDNKYNAEKERLEKVINRKNKQLEKLQNDRQNLDKTIDDQNQTIRDLRSNISKLNTTIQKMKDDHNAVIKLNESMAVQRLHKYMDRNKSLGESFTELNNKFERLRNYITKLHEFYEPYISKYQSATNDKQKLTLQNLFIDDYINYIKNNPLSNDDLEGVSDSDIDINQDNKADADITGGADINTSTNTNLCVLAPFVIGLITISKYLVIGVIVFCMIIMIVYILHNLYNNIKFDNSYNDISYDEDNNINYIPCQTSQMISGINQ